ncbi:MAG: HD domain-containing protein [Myxococcota bacterium]
MLLRDPVHGLVAFEGDAERVVTSLLATREAQRLRRVRQLGLTALVFPGAEHSRFAHAIGAAHVMVRLLARIRQVEGALDPALRLDREAARDAIAAALLHDLGHGPFSHLFEELLPGGVAHESWTYRVIEDPGTEVHAALEGLSRGMAARVAGLLRGHYRIGYLARAVAGTLDVDRADYLLRDSHMTGVSYGLYDLDWLLRSFSFGFVGTEAVLAVEGRKGLPPIEAFFVGRHYMYQQVYHHKATRSAEALVRAIFTRVGELARGNRPPEGTPGALVAAARGNAVSLGDYLELDDAELWSCFARWARDDDAELGRLAGAIRARRLPKTVPLPQGEGERERWDAALEVAQAVVREAGMREDLHVRLDVPGSVPYDEPRGEGPEGLWVLIRHRPIQRLGDASFVLRQLRGKKVRRPRLIVPAALRRDVIRALGSLLDPCAPSEDDDVLVEGELR